MAEDKILTRRQGLKAALMLGLTTGPGAAASPVRAQQTSGDGKVLVAYFSRTGNTRVIARQIRRALDADLFEIQPAAAYPEDYEETVAQATREREAGYEPPLAARLPQIATPQTVFLGFPSWGMSVPPVIRTFLRQHDLSGKKLIPFITHGGYGLGNSLSVIAAHASRACLRGEFSMEADQERRTLEQVSGWLGDVQTPG